MTTEVSTFYLDKLNVFVCCSTSDFKVYAKMVLENNCVVGLGESEEEALDDFRFNLQLSEDEKGSPQE